MTTTTTSLIEPTAVDEPRVVVPCECPEWADCAAHGTGPCDQTAQWMVGCGHCAEPGATECTSEAKAVCGPCLEQVRAWAAAAFRAVEVCSGGCCPMCGAKLTSVSQLIRSVVPL